MHAAAYLEHAFWLHVTNLAVSCEGSNHPVVAQHVLLCNVAVQVDVRFSKACMAPDIQVDCKSLI